MIDKDVRLYFSNIVSTALGPYYDTYLEDFENIEKTKLIKRICVLHRGETTLIETKGAGIAEYETPYTVCLIIPKDIKGFTGDKTSNNERLDDFINALATDIETANGTTGRPWSKPAILNTYGYADQEDPIGIFGELNFKNKLVFYATVNITHRRVFSC